MTIEVTRNARPTRNTTPDDVIAAATNSNAAALRKYAAVRHRIQRRRKYAVPALSRTRFAIRNRLYAEPEVTSAMTVK
jgi:hypothetical protein